MIIINATEDEDKTRQVDKMNVRRALAKKNKKSSSKKRETEVNGNGTIKIEKSDDGDDIPLKSGKREPSTSNGRASPSTSKRSSEETNLPAKKSKVSTTDSKSDKDNKPGPSSSSSKLSKYSVSKDPNASEAYKSLFTSHQSAQNQQKAHWVTYNPFYN